MHVFDVAVEAKTNDLFQSTEKTFSGEEKFTERYGFRTMAAQHALVYAMETKERNHSE